MYLRRTYLHSINGSALFKAEIKSLCLKLLLHCTEPHSVTILIQFVMDVRGALLLNFNFPT